MLPSRESRMAGRNEHLEARGVRRSEGFALRCAMQRARRAYLVIGSWFCAARYLAVAFSHWALSVRGLRSLTYANHIEPIKMPAIEMAVVPANTATAGLLNMPPLPAIRVPWKLCACGHTRDNAQRPVERQRSGVRKKSKSVPELLSSSATTAAAAAAARQQFRQQKKQASPCTQQDGAAARVPERQTAAKRHRPLRRPKAARGPKAAGHDGSAKSREKNSPWLLLLWWGGQSRRGRAARSAPQETLHAARSPRKSVASPHFLHVEDSE
jgi:hypothetical protein